MLSIAVCSMLHDMVLVGSKWNGGKDTHKIGERCTCSVGSFDNSGLSVGSQQDDIIKLIFFGISHKPRWNWPKKPRSSEDSYVMME